MREKLGINDLIDITYLMKLRDEMITFDKVKKIIYELVNLESLWKFTELCKAIGPNEFNLSTRYKKQILQ